MLLNADPELLTLLSHWGYPSMLLIMILEGPIATLTAAFLASLGYFNVVLVFCISVIGDIIGDIILYTIGYHGGRRILLKAEKLLKVKSSLVGKMEKQFEKRGPKIIFYVKSTTGLIYITFLLAGVTRMNFKKFLYYTTLGGLVWSFVLVVLGYFFGYAAVKISSYIKYAGIGIFVLAALTLIVINLIKKYRTKDIIDSSNGNH